MEIKHKVIDSNTNDLIQYSLTANIDFTANNLGLIGVAHGSTTAAAPIISKVSSSNRTWSKKTSFLYVNQANGTRSLDIFYSIVSSNTNSNITFEFDSTVQSAVWSIIEISGVSISGSGTGAFRQMASAYANACAISVELCSLANTKNRIICYNAIIPLGSLIFEDTNYTVISSGAVNTPVNRISNFWRNDDSADLTIQSSTNVVNHFAGIGLELVILDSNLSSLNYEQGYEISNIQLTKNLIANVFEQGYEIANANLLQLHELITQSYEQGFEISNSQIIKNIVNIDYEQGYEINSIDLDQLHELITQAYEQGHEINNSQLIKNILIEGYEQGYEIESLSLSIIYSLITQSYEQGIEISSVNLAQIHEIITQSFEQIFELSSPKLSGITSLINTLTAEFGFDVSPTILRFFGVKRKSNSMRRKLVQQHSRPTRKDI